jgi:hypothetical protein
MPHSSSKRRPHLPVKNHTVKPAKQLRRFAWLMMLAAIVLAWRGASDFTSVPGWLQFSIGLTLAAPALFWAGRSREIALIAPRKDVAVTEKWFLDLWQSTYPVTEETVITVLRQQNDPHLARVVIEMKEPKSGESRPVYLDRGPQRYPRAIGVAREAALYLNVDVRELLDGKEPASSAASVQG